MINLQSNYTYSKKKKEKKEKILTHLSKWVKGNQKQLNFDELVDQWRIPCIVVEDQRKSLILYMPKKMNLCTCQHVMR